MAPVIHECERRDIDLFLLHTGQHYSDIMSQMFFRDMGLREPDKNLNIGSGSHSEQTAKALVGIEKELLRVDPDVVLVLGDTNAVLSAALAAIKVGIPVGHVEAGLRSYDLRMPEEHNRRLTDHMSEFLFAPTERSADTLRREHVWGKVFVTGNTVIDALEGLIQKVAGRRTVADELGLTDFALLTLHRPENVDDESVLSGLIRGLVELDTEILFPAHPRTVSRLKEFNLVEEIERNDKFHLVEPTGYLEFLALMKSCMFVLTDSGGIQEEVTAPSINKRAFVLRTSTERPEAVESGHAIVVGVDPRRFPTRIEQGMKDGLTGMSGHPYGSGNASKKTIDFLIRNLQ